jgi:hypothetical protein
MVDPATYRLIGDHDPAFGQQVLDITEAQGEPGIEPDGLLNDWVRSDIRRPTSLRLDIGGLVVAERTGDRQSNCSNNCEERNASSREDAGSAEYISRTRVATNPLLQQHVAADHDEREDGVARPSHMNL